MSAVSRVASASFHSPRFWWASPAARSFCASSSPIPPADPIKPRGRHERHASEHKREHKREHTREHTRDCHGRAKSGASCILVCFGQIPPILGLSFRIEVFRESEASPTLLRRLGYLAWVSMRHCACADYTPSPASACRHFAEQVKACPSAPHAS